MDVDELGEPGVARFGAERFERRTASEDDACPRQRITGLEQEGEAIVVARDVVDAGAGARLERAEPRVEIVPMAFDVSETRVLVGFVDPEVQHVAQENERVVVALVQQRSKAFLIRIPDAQVHVRADEDAL